MARWTGRDRAMSWAAQPVWVAAHVGERPDELAADWAEEPQSGPPPPAQDGAEPPEAPWSGPPTAVGVKRRRGWWPFSLPKPLGRILKILLFLLIVEYLVLPQFKGTHKALHLISEVNLFYLAAGIGLEAAAVFAYVQLTK